MYNIFRHTAHFYDLDQYPENNKDIPYFLKKAKQAEGPLLELACGTGRIAIPLAEAGFEVYGIDISETMLTIFDRKRLSLADDVQQRLHIQQADMRHFHFYTSFSSIFVPFHSFQALLSDQDIQQCLHHIYQHLTANGQLIINVAHFAPDFIMQWQSGLETQETSHITDHRQWVTLSTVLRQLDTQEQTLSYDNIYRVYSPGRQPEVYEDPIKIRYYEPADIQQLLETAGFTITAAWGDYDGSPLGTTDDMIFECRKTTR